MTDPTTIAQGAVPKHIINAITQYGDSRADDGLASGPALGRVIAAINEYYGPALRAFLAAVPASEPVLPIPVMEKYPHGWDGVDENCQVWLREQPNGARLYAAATAPVSGMPDLAKVESGCRMNGGICACHSGGSYGGCVREREYCCAAPLPAAPAPTEQAGELPPLPEPHMRRGEGLTAHYSKKQMQDYARAALAARQAPTEDEFAKMMSDVKVTHIACMMGNMIYNLSQKKGHILTDADCEMFNNLREQWDAARQAPTEAPKDRGDVPVLSAVRHAIYGLNEYRAGRALSFPSGAIGIIERFVDARPAPDSRDAALDVLAERQRQKDVEGWTLEHDDEHGYGVMAEAAACYIGGNMYWSAFDTKQRWPWSISWWKPKDPRRNLVRAAALLIAEIERIDRAAIAKEKAQ